MVIVDCPVSLLNPDDAATTDAYVVYDHLKYFLSKTNTFPIVTIRVHGYKGYVVRGLAYLNIAKEVNKKHIRAIISKQSQEEEIEKFLQCEGVAPLELGALYLEDEKTDRSDWHVFFLEKPLDNRVVDQFRAGIMDLVKDGQLENWRVDTSRGLVEFKLEPVYGNELWVSRFVAMYTAFSQTTHKIVSYQGRSLAENISTSS